MKKIIVLLATSLWLWSCSKSTSDKENPLIGLVSIVNTNIEVGNSLTVTSSITDNNELSAYKIVIANSFPFTEKETYTATRLNTSITENISGNSFALNKTISIPANTASGEYTITITVIDNKGNNTSSSGHKFTVINTAQSPTITLLEPLDNSVYNTTDTLKLDGNITATNKLDQFIVSSKSDSTWNNNQTIQLDTLNITNWDIKTDGKVTVPLPNYNTSITSTVYAVDTTGGYHYKNVTFRVN